MSYDTSFSLFAQQPGDAKILGGAETEWFTEDDGDVDK